MPDMINQSPQDTLLSKATIRWALSKTALVTQTPTSWIYKAQRDDGKLAALKLIRPGTGLDERRSGALLEWYRGQSAVAVYAYDSEAILMEWVEGTTLAGPARNGRDQEATIAICKIVADLHEPRPNPPDILLPLRDYFQPLFDTDVRQWPHTARDLYARAVGIAMSIFDRPTASVPLHGDLHHDNIVMADRGWVALDPKGLRGDPVYDVANIFLNPWGEAKLCADSARIVAVTEIIGQRLGFPKKRILAYAAAHAALSACFAIEDGFPINWQLAVLPNLLAAYDGA